MCSIGLLASLESIFVQLVFHMRPSPDLFLSHIVQVVSAASAYHAGGGMMTGGRHALEEATCMQSTLYRSLEKGIQLAKDDGYVYFNSKLERTLFLFFLF